MKSDIIIKAEKLTIGYEKSRNSAKKSLYQNLNFDLQKGELVCLLGSNGAGKSTLIRTICGAQASLEGRIFLQEKEINSYTERELSRLLGLVLTDKTATGGLLVRELVELGRYPYTGFFGQLASNDKEIVQKAMEDVSIAHKANSYVAELSDGERQKTMIAKALAQECPVILLDEPTAFLDIESRIEIMDLLHKLAMDNQKTILLSTHDIDQALLLADRLWLLSREKGLTTGVTEDIILTGIMSNFFRSENIKFDIDFGTFLPNRDSDKKVFIKETEGYLNHWTQNILERHGFAITENVKESLFTVQVSSPEFISIEFASGKTPKHLNNFAYFADLLRDLR